MKNFVLKYKFGIEVAIQDQDYRLSNVKEQLLYIVRQGFNDFENEGVVRGGLKKFKGGSIL